MKAGKVRQSADSAGTFSGLGASKRDAAAVGGDHGRCTTRAFGLDKPGTLVYNKHCEIRPGSAVAGPGGLLGNRLGLRECGTRRRGRRLLAGEIPWPGGVVRAPDAWRWATGVATHAVGGRGTAFSLTHHLEVSRAGPSSLFRECRWRKRRTE